MVRIKVGQHGSPGTNSEDIFQEIYNSEIYKRLKSFVQSITGDVRGKDVVDYGVIPAAAGLGLGITAGILQNLHHEVSLFKSIKEQRERITKNINKEPIIIDIDAEKEKERRRSEKKIKKFIESDDEEGFFSKLPSLKGLIKKKDKDKNAPKTAQDESGQASGEGEPRWYMFAFSIPALLGSFIIGYNLTRIKDIDSSELVNEQLDKARREYIKSIYGEMLKKRRNEKDDLSKFLKKKSIDLLSEKELPQSLYEVDQEINKFVELSKKAAENPELLQKSAGMVKQAAVLDILMYVMFPGILASALTGSSWPAVLNMVISGGIFSLSAYNAYRDNIDVAKEEKLKQTHRMVEALQTKYQEAPIILKYKRTNQKETEQPLQSIL